MILVGNIFSGIINGVPLSLTTMGDSGPASLDTTTGILNIPVYTGGGGSGITDADNGLQVEPDGITVGLGGNPLNQTTIIDQQDNPIEFLTTNSRSIFANSTDIFTVQQNEDLGDPGSVVTTFRMAPGGTGANGFKLIMNDAAEAVFSCEFDLQEFFIRHVVNDIANNVASEINLDATGGGDAQLNLALSNFISGLTKRLLFQLENGAGIVVTDSVDNIGLAGDELFPINNNNQYAQYGNTVGNSPFIVQSQIGNGNVANFNIPVSLDQVFVLNVALTMNGAGSAIVTLTYTNMDGAPKSVSVITGVGADVDYYPPSFTFRALQGTTVSLDVVSISGIWSVSGSFILVAQT